MVNSATITGIVNADIAAGAAIAFSKIAQANIDGALLTGLGNILSGSGVIPAANLTSVAQKGANSDITSLTGLTTPLSEAQGGTGTTTNNGRIIQIVNTQTGAMATGTTILPADNTIPQNTEGDEYMTLAITPTSATNNLKIDVVVFGTHSAAGENGVALFQDTTANALASGFSILANAANAGVIMFSHFMTAGTTSETTFKVRAGGQQSGTFTFNGIAGAYRHGGKVASSITITEIRV